MAKFEVGDKIVYLAYGVGTIDGRRTENIGGMELKMLVLSFCNKLTICVPEDRAAKSGLRHISSNKEMQDAMQILKAGRTMKSKLKKMNWNKRSDDYEERLSAGDIVSVAKLVRELHDLPEQSYTERNTYEAALSCLVSEYAVTSQIEEKQARKLLQSMLSNETSIAP